MKEYIRHRQINAAYIVWSLLRSGTSVDLGKELSYLQAEYQRQDDAYFKALVGEHPAVEC